jgi:hypothetical protein
MENAYATKAGKAKTAVKGFVLITALETAFARRKESACAKDLGKALTVLINNAKKVVEKKAYAQKENVSARLGGLEKNAI